jgi:hypothetical protein
MIPSRLGLRTNVPERQITVSPQKMKDPEADRFCSDSLGEAKYL